MFIIWGSTTLNKKVGSGAFYCPRCRDHRPYAHMRTREYFTFYFIPLFATDTLGEYLVCGDCASTFPTDVRDHTPEEIEHMRRPWKCLSCQGLNPPSEMTCLLCKAKRPRPYEAEYPPLDRPKPEPLAAPDAVARLASHPDPDLADLIKGKECRECGVKNSVVAVRCKGCGGRLSAS